MRGLLAVLLLTLGLYGQAWEDQKKQMNAR
jgi:hypothetical protein